jgi:hypothetical protein
MTRTLPPSLAHTLREAFAADPGDGPTIAIHKIMVRLEHQALAVLIFLFALPNVVPTPPGTSAITGLPLFFLTLQMALSRPPWLPGFLTQKEIPVATLNAVLDRAEPWLARIERAIHPRLSALTGDLAGRLVGVLGLCLSLVIMLPIPLGNSAPALSLCIIAMGFLGRDGAWVLIGVTGAFAAVGLLFGVYGAAVLALVTGLG